MPTLATFFGNVWALCKRNRGRESGKNQLHLLDDLNTFPV